jgi:hypothetical protein
VDPRLEPRLSGSVMTPQHHPGLGRDLDLPHRRFPRIKAAFGQPRRRKADLVGDDVLCLGVGGPEPAAFE